MGRTPAAPRDAATIILVRNGPSGVEVFCVERSKKSRFLGGALVFPGGKLDPSDVSEEWRALATEPRALRPSLVPFTTDTAHLRALAIAASRETLEEAAMLHVEGGAVVQDELFALRARLTGDT